MYEFVERAAPSYDSEGMTEHYIDENGNCFILENDKMMQVAEESLAIPALVSIENDLVPEETDVTVVVLEKAQEASFFDLISDFFDSMISFFLRLFSFNR